MNILIIEDEAPIAAYIANGVRSLLGKAVDRLTIVYTFTDGLRQMMETDIDLCLMDLNLRGKSGYEILQQAVSRPFHTIIISAHTELAARAFDYGVIDFVPKPFSQSRLKQALDRFLSTRRTPHAARHLTYRLGIRHCLLPVEEIRLLKGCRYLVEAIRVDGQKVLLEKPLNRLEQVLPDRFFRIHRSYIVPIDLISSFEHLGSSRYRVLLKSGESLPLSRDRVADLKARLEGPVV